MIVLTAAVTYLIAVPLIWWCLRRSRLPLLRIAARPGTRRGRPNARESREHARALGRLPALHVARLRRHR